MLFFRDLPGSNTNIGHCSWCNYSIHQLLNDTSKQEIKPWHQSTRRWLKYTPRENLYPSKVGTPSCLPAGRREPWWPLGCRCCEAFSLSRLFSASRLSSVPRPAPKSKRSSKTPRANWPNPGGNGNKCDSAFWERKKEWLFCPELLMFKELAKNLPKTKASSFKFCQGVAYGSTKNEFKENVIPSSYAKH